MVSLRMGLRGIRMRVRVMLRLRLRLRGWGRGLGLGWEFTDFLTNPFLIFFFSKAKLFANIGNIFQCILEAMQQNCQESHKCWEWNGHFFPSFQIPQRYWDDSLLACGRESCDDLPVLQTSDGLQKSVATKLLKFQADIYQVPSSNMWQTRMPCLWVPVDKTRVQNGLHLTTELAAMHIESGIKKQGKTRRDETRHNKTRHDNTQHKTRKTTQDKMSQVDNNTCRKYSAICHSDA